MPSILKFAICVVVVPAAAACASASTVRSSAEPVSQGPSRDSVLASLATSADSIALAKAIADACAREADKPKCYEQSLAKIARTGRVKVAMGALSQIARVNPDIRRTGHVYAHAIGIAAGKPRGDIAGTFPECSESFQSGCYHGVIQAWFSGIDSLGAADANALCAPFRASEKDRWIRFQCVHGMGHGLTMLYKHDLPKGLAGCDLLTEWWDRHSCYSGAFMENIVNVTMPHHPASSMTKGNTSHGGHKDHDAHAAEHHGATAFKPVDPSDQLYPCSIMAERYLSACYEMQTSVMLHNNKGDIAGAAKSCETAPAAMRTVCFASLGRDISSYSQQNHAEAIRLCSLAAAKYQPWCYFGVVKNFIDLEARPEDGLSLCRSIPISDGKAMCYQAVGEQILVLAPNSDERRAACASAENEYLDACLYGARLGTAPQKLLRVWEAVRDVK
jgi:hypothetical protein